MEENKMMFLLGVLLGMLSGAAAVAAFNKGDDDRFTEGFNSGVDYANHRTKCPDGEV